MIKGYLAKEDSATQKMALPPKFNILELATGVMTHLEMGDPNLTSESLQIAKRALCFDSKTYVILKCMFHQSQPFKTTFISNLSKQLSFSDTEKFKN